jgi:ecotin
MGYRAILAYHQIQNIAPQKHRGNRFVTLGGEPYLIRYISRLPIVVYAPKDVEVRYRVWSAGPDVKVIEEG